MEKFWRAAITVAGIGAVAFFVFFGLYKQWLSLSIFADLTSEQTFVLMMTFLALTFLALIAGLLAWLRPSHESEETALHRLETTWQGVNHIDCGNLIGPDVARAANALQMTSVYWRNGFISKDVLLERYGDSYCDLFDALDSCNCVVPGYEKLKKRCRDFIDTPTRSTAHQIKLRMGRHAA